MNRLRTIVQRILRRMLHVKQASVAVILPCHNYAHFLEGAIDCVLAQTMAPIDILVLDDASDDHPEVVARKFWNRGVRYARAENRSLSKTRNDGAAWTQSEFLLYLDPDDRLPRNYIEQCLSVMQGPTVGIAYGDLQYTGEKSDYVVSPECSEEGLLRSNFISSHALIRRQAFDLVGGYRDIARSLEDWDFYRRVVQAGYGARKAPTHVRYRIHADSMAQRHNRDPERSYSRDAALEESPITIFTPFAGRVEVFDRYYEALKGITWKSEHLRLHWYNTSSDPEFDRMLREALLSLSFGEMRYTHAPIPEAWGHTPESLIRDRIKNQNDAEYYYQMAVVRAYNHMIQTCSTEYVLTLEDDNIIAPETLSRLVSALDWNVAAVVAPYKSVLFPRYEVWMPTPNGTVSNFRERGTGIEEVGGSGFGCTLFRMSDLRRIAPLKTGVRETPKRWYDQITYTRLKERGKILCDWDAEVGHVPTERFTKGLATNFT